MRDYFLPLDLQLFAEEEDDKEPKEEVPSWVKSLQTTMEKIAEAVTPKTDGTPNPPAAETEEAVTITVPKVESPPAEEDDQASKESASSAEDKPQSKVKAGKSLARWFLGN